jgi:hypothetical protein
VPYYEIIRGCQEEKLMHCIEAAPSIIFALLSRSPHGGGFLRAKVEILEAARCGSALRLGY